MPTHEYHLKTILWVEDRWEMLNGWAHTLSGYDSIIQTFGQGERLNLLTNETMSYLPETEAQGLVETIIDETRNKPTFLNLRIAQLAKTYLQRVTPGAILLDSEFPGGGYREIVRCLREQNLAQYPLISWTAKEFSELRPELQEMLGQPPRYVDKLDTKTEKLVKYLLSARTEVEQISLRQP